MLGVKCSDEELQAVVESIIENRVGDLFSFKQLVDLVCTELDKLNHLNKQANTRYEGGVKLNHIDIDKIQKIVWTLIWDRKLMLDLYNDEYRYTPDRTSMRLIKMK
ncbi:MAG: hypothetical protein R3Y16_00015 [Rikenellaceae bacterium]